MKLILTTPVDKLGAPGDVVEVKDGYGRNFLVPRGFAIRWTRGAEKQIDGIKRSRAAREIRGIDHAEQVRNQLEDLTIDLPARAGDTGKLFGAVTAGDVAAAISPAVTAPNSLPVSPARAGRSMVKSSSWLRTSSA